MKKCLAMLCMLTCIFGLTACGSETQVSEEVQSYSEAAQAMTANYLIPYMTNFFDDDLADTFSSEYDVEELEFITENYFSNMFSTNSGISTIEVEGNAILTGITSFNDAYDTIGDIVSLGTPEVEIDNDTITVLIEVTGTLTDKDGAPKKAEVEAIYSNDLFLRVEGITMNVEQTMSALMAKAAMDTLMGMGTVFCILIFISLLISCFKIVPYMQERAQKKKDAKSKEANGKAESVDNTIAQIIEKEENVLSDDLELVAVISAAIAASEGSASTDGFVVRSIRKRR